MDTLIEVLSSDEVYATFQSATIEDIRALAKSLDAPFVEDNTTIPSQDDQSTRLPPIRIEPDGQLPLAFWLFREATPVPEPSTAWLAVAACFTSLRLRVLA